MDGRGVGGAAPDPGQAVEAARAPTVPVHAHPGVAQHQVQAGVIMPARRGAGCPLSIRRAAAWPAAATRARRRSLTSITPASAR